MYLYLFQLYEAVLDGHKMDDIQIVCDTGSPAHVYIIPQDECSFLGMMRTQDFINTIDGKYLGHPVSKHLYSRIINVST